MTSLLANLQTFSDSIVEQHQIPAVSLAIWHDNQLYQAASGILNINTGVKATTDSIFQIGSITKVFTTCLVMQLVDEGRVNLDAPVVTYLRDFRVADTEATQTITVRQLLNHTNGIAGDYFPRDANAEGNLIARYVDRINLIPLVHAPGAQFSYSNAAFAVAGRLVEVVAGLPWSQLMAERIFEPLGMTHATADPNEILRYRAAIGHFPDPEKPQKWIISPNCYSTLGLAPAGTTPTMSAADLIIFASAHLNMGKASSGIRWLSANSVELMQTLQIGVPPISDIFDLHRGLGWGILTDKRSGDAAISHEGKIAGQNAMLMLFPSRDTAFSVLLNGVKVGVMDSVVNELTKELTGIDIKEPQRPPVKMNPVEIISYTGTFESFDAVYQIYLSEDMLVSEIPTLVVTRIDRLHDISDQFSWRPLGRHVFSVYTDTGHRLSNAIFMANNDSIPQQLLVGGRLNNRISPPFPKKHST